MKRLFYISLGAAAGIAAVRKLTRAADRFTPPGVARAFDGLTAGVRDFTAEVRLAMAEREIELRDALGFDDAANEPTAREDVR